MRLLRLNIEEPLPGRVLPLIANSHGDEEACRRYRAIVITTLRQLKDLTDTEILIDPHPTDAGEAIRFWILPRLAHRWQAMDDGGFHSPEWKIRFSASTSRPDIIADGNILCPWLGARLLHTAMLGLEHKRSQHVGHSPDGTRYLHARHRDTHDHDPVIELPSMPVIHNHEDWLEALDSALGPALKRAYEEESKFV